MIEITSSVDINRDPTEVFDFIADWVNNPTWQSGMKTCTWTSDRPLQLGSTYDQEASFLGRPIISSFEVVELEPGKRLRIRTTKSSLPLDVTREVHRSPSGGARVMATVRGEPRGAVRLLNPLTKVMVRKSVRKDYATLKELLERAH